MSKVIQEKNHAFYVESVIPNINEKIIPGLFANIRVVLGEKVAVVRIPSSAIVYDGNRNSVFVVNGTIVHKTYVEVGESNGDYVDVASGLQRVKSGGFGEN